MPGEGDPPPRRHQSTEDVPIWHTGAAKANFASAHAVRTPRALSPYLLQCCVFKISYMHLLRQGHEIRSEHTVQNGFQFFPKILKIIPLRHGTALTDVLF